MGIAGDSYYRFKQLYEEKGEAGLQEVSRRKSNYKNRVASEVEEAVIRFATEQPAYGQLRVSHELKKQGVFVSPQGVRYIWLRNGLNTMGKRLQVLEAKVAKEGLILTERQLQALEKKKAHQEAHGEIETLFPGYLGSQDTYYVGNIKGVGKIYQQTFVDTYSKVAICKLYDRKNALVAADLQSDRVVPFFEEQGVKLLRMLTEKQPDPRNSRDLKNGRSGLFVRRSPVYYTSLLHWLFDYTKTLHPLLCFVYRSRAGRRSARSDLKIH